MSLGLWKEIISYGKNIPMASLSTCPAARISSELFDNCMISFNCFTRIADFENNENHIRCKIVNYLGAMFARWWLRKSTAPEQLPGVNGEESQWVVKDHVLHVHITKETDQSTSAYICSLGDIFSLGLISQLHLFNTRCSTTVPELYQVLSFPVGLKTLRIRRTAVELNEFLTLITTNAQTITVIELTNFTIPTLQIVGLCPNLTELELRGTAVQGLKMLIGESRDSAVEATRGDKLHRPFSDLAPLKHLRRIDLSKSMHNNYSGLSFCDSLRTLNLTSTNVSTSDLESIGKLPHLRELFLSHTKVDCITPLEHCSSLQVLQLVNSDIDSKGLIGVDRLRELRHLDLSNTKVDDVQVLSGCLSLSVLLLPKTRISSPQCLDGLQKLPNLEQLVVSDNRIRSISSMSGSLSLKRLFAKCTLVNNDGIVGIENLKQLEELNLAQSQVTNVSNLRNMENLKKLDLFGCRLTGDGIDGLADIPTLEELILTKTDVDNVQCLSGSKALRDLCIKQGSIKGAASIRGIQDITTLQSLTLTHCAIETLEGFRSLHNLQKLNLWANCLTTEGIQYLRGMESLTEVDLAETDILDPSVLFTCPNIRTLVLYTTKINSIEGIDRLKFLCFLDLAGTQVSQLHSLSACDRLETLNISDTVVDDEGFVNPEKLYSLRKIFMSSSLVSRIGMLGRCSKLEEIWAQNCPIESDGIIGLEGAHNLLKLNLSYTLIKGGVFRLSSCKLLQKLNLKFTEIPAEEIAFLHQQLPSCRVYEGIAPIAENKNDFS